MHVRLVLVSLALLACAPASTNEEPVEPARVNEPDPSPEPTPPIPPQSMVEQMIGELVLGHPRVATYLHTVPVTVWPIPELALGAPSMRARGELVRVVDREADAHFRFRAYEALASAAQVRVRFEIPSEGVAGHVDVELRDYVWEIVDASVTER